MKIHYLDFPENRIILTLEDLLDKARRGEIDSLFVAGTLECGDVISAFLLLPDGPLYTLLGTIEAAKSVLVAECDQHFRETICSGSL